MPSRKKVPVFLSFDYDYDTDLRTLLLASIHRLEAGEAKDEEKKYFVLGGRKSGSNRRPRGAAFWVPVHDWTWDNLGAMTSGKTLPWWKTIW